MKPGTYKGIAYTSNVSTAALCGLRRMEWKESIIRLILVIGLIILAYLALFIGERWLAIILVICQLYSSFSSRMRQLEDRTARALELLEKPNLEV